MSPVGAGRLQGYTGKILLTVMEDRKRKKGLLVLRRFATKKSKTNSQFFKTMLKRPQVLLLRLYCKRKSNILKLMVILDVARAIAFLNALFYSMKTLL